MSDDGSGSEKYRFCTSCGAEAHSGASFCGECGYSLLKGHPQMDASIVSTSDSARGDTKDAPPTSPTEPDRESREQPERTTDEARVCYNCSTTTTGNEPRCLKCGRSLSKRGFEREPPAVSRTTPEPEIVPYVEPAKPCTVREIHEARAQTAVADKPKKRQKRVQSQAEKRLSWLIVSWIVLFGLGAKLSNPVNPLAVRIIGGIILVPPVGLVAVLFVWGVYKVGTSAGNAMGGAIVEASRPMPTPAEIESSLRQELGRPPTIAEVAAVHQMLISEKNQAMIIAGISVGALYMMEKNLHGT